MLITRVELEEIKSHKHAIFEFERGTTAITGANGAGKTSIIEAVAWALFDFLEYNRDDFARRGAKKGAVRVTFQSGLDDRFYTVYRDTGGKHWVYDEEQKTRIHEQNANVVNFLRQQLKVEPGTNLKELYRAAIGVPQGTFTAVFLDAATTRKTVFDRLLKVEEYREGARKLGETVNLIKQKRQDVKIRLAVAESDLANLETVEREHTETAAEVVELEGSLTALREEIAGRGALVGEFETARQRLEAAGGKLRETETANSQAAFRRQKLIGERDAAQAAAARLVALEPDFLKYAEAERAADALERERMERDRLKTKQAEVDKNLIDAKARRQFLEENLRRASEAAREAAALAPAIVEQGRLESEYKNLLDRRAAANAARTRVDELEPQIVSKRAEYQELSKNIKDGERGASAAAEIEMLEANRREVETALTEADRAAAQLDVLQPQVRQTQREIEKAAADLEILNAEIVDVERAAAGAARVGELTALETDLREKIANLRAEIELNAKFENQVRRGVCPVMPDRCLNLREGEAVASYLDGKSGETAVALKNYEAERSRAANELTIARQAENAGAKLPTLRRQRETQERQLKELERGLQTNALEIVAFAKFAPGKRETLRGEKNEIEAKLRQLQEDAKKYAALEGLRKRIEDLKTEGKRLADEQSRLKETADARGAIERDIAANQLRLGELDNPAARAENLRREAARETDLKTQISRVETQISQFESDKQNLEIELARFAALDEKLSAIRTELEATRAAHFEYLQIKPLAERLPQFETELEHLTAEAERLQIELDAARTEHEAARADYDAEKHQIEKNALELARRDESAANATLRARAARANQLAAELERLKTVRAAMNDDLQEQERLRGLAETTDYIRETLKAAAPHVGEILRYEIAKEATNLFREVTGEVGRSLKWTEDYEILLDENGYQRPFVNLSGGEQMAAALSIRLALLTQLSDIRIAFFDEPTTNLDSERRENLARQIGQITNFNQLFVISHDDTFESNVDHTIVVGAN